MKRINYYEGIKDDYKKLFQEDLEGFNTRWDNWKKKYDSKGTLNKSVEDLLVAPFDELVDIYYKFRDLKIPEKGLDGKRNPILVELDEIFKYKEKYDSKIAEFFIEKSRCIGITSCYYCEMSYVNTYTLNDGGVMKRQFDLDHFLPKGKCPCLGLSLFNFVPSCQVCNSRIKGEKLPSEIKEELVKLSPSSEDYDVENNMSIRLRPGLVKESSLLDTYIYFRTKHPYQKFVSFFHLQERYEFHKEEALRLKRLKDNYPASNIRKIARLLGRSEREIEEDIFQKKYLTEEGRCFRRLTLDILENRSID